MKIQIKIESYKFQGSKELFFSDVNFDIVGNGFYLLTGLSGAGKSTLMKLLLGIHEGDFKGNVFYEDSSEVLSGFEMRKRGLVGYQPDDFSLIPWKTVKDNISLPAIVNNNLQKIHESQIIGELKSLGLSSGILSKYPHELSFGMKARVGLIRSCLYNPKVLFLDELFSGIDSVNGQRIVEYLAIKRRTSLIIAISHQVEKAFPLCDKILIVGDNKKVKIHEPNSINSILHNITK